jgi:membrane fusion protein (multidrug efflux system)|nr:efflux RND transporter periplasmic adaptor subunit [Kofleriaceae bacterium]
MRTLSILAAAGTLVACTQDKPAPPPPPPAQVGTAVVGRRDVPLFVEAIGTLDGYVDAEIRARVRGYLLTQTFKDGGPVKAGQVLFTIEPTEYQAGATSAAAVVSRAKTDLAKAKLDLERDQGLFKAGMISRQEVDNATAAVADSEAQIRAAEAQQQQASLSVGYATLRSPIDGVAGLAQVRVGNLVGQDGPTLLTTVSQIDPVRVDFPLAEIDYVREPERYAHLDNRDLAWAKTELARLDHAPDDPNGLELVLADGKVYAHHGVIVAIDRKIDATTGTVQLQALVSNPDGVLRPGESVRVHLRRDDAGKDAVVVPEKGLISVQGSYSVAIVGPDSKIKMQKVELGDSSNGLRIVTKGLAGGETIVVDGVQRIQDGATVVAKPAGNGSAAGSGSAGSAR